MEYMESGDKIMNICFLSGNEANHNYVISEIIDQVSVDRYVILKIHSGIPDIDYYTNIFKKETMSSEETSYLIRFIEDRNKTFKDYKGLKFDEELIVNNARAFNDRLDEITVLDEFDCILSYGVPIIKNKKILHEGTRSVNLHFGLSRYYRGADTNIYALARNEFDKVGVTAHQLAQKVDSGRILFEMTLGDDDFLESETINELSALLLVKTVNKLIGILNHGKFSYHDTVYEDSPLILDSMVTLDDIIKAETNLKEYKRK